MAEGYQGLDKGYFVRKQSDLKWVQTFRMTLRSPAVANRIFDTKQHAIDFINDTSDSASAVEGLILAVYKDETFGNNGLYFVKSIKELVEDKDESGNTIFVETEDGKLLQIYDSDNDKPIKLQELENKLSDAIKNLQEVCDNLNLRIDNEVSGLTNTVNILEDKVDENVNDLIETIDIIDNKVNENNDNLNNEISGLTNTLNILEDKVDENVNDLNEKIDINTNNISSINNTKQDKLIAGDNIEISGNTISSTYTFDDTNLQNKIDEVKNNMVFSGITSQESFTVNALGNTTIGAIKNGVTINSTDTLMDILKKMFLATLKPTVNANPSCSMSNSGSAFTTYEVGTVVTATLSASYTDGNFNSYENSSTSTEVITAGCAQGDTTFYYNNVVLTGNTKTLTLSEGNTGNFQAKITYSASTNIPKASDGTEATDVKISAGTASSSTNKYTAYYYIYGGFCPKLSEGLPKLPTSSDEVKKLTEFRKYFTTSTANTQTLSTKVYTENSYGENSYSIVIAAPKGNHTITVTDAKGDSYTVNKSTNEIDVNIGGTSTQKYNLWYINVNGASFKDLKIKRSNITIG